MVPTQGQRDPVHEYRDVPVGGTAQTRLSLAPRIVPDAHQRHLTQRLFQRRYRHRTQRIETHFHYPHSAGDGEAATGHDANPIQSEAVGIDLDDIRTERVRPLGLGGLGPDAQDHEGRRQRDQDGRFTRCCYGGWYRQSRNRMEAVAKSKPKSSTGAEWVIQPLEM